MDELSTITKHKNTFKEKERHTTEQTKNCVIIIINMHEKSATLN